MTSDSPRAEAGYRGPDRAFSVLRTDRLVLRRFRHDDVGSLAAYRSAPEVARYQSWDVPFTEQDAVAFIASLQESHPDVPGEWYQMAVTDRRAGGHLGDVGIFVDGEDPRLARVGITLAPAAHGRGYATEALQAVLDYLFGARGKHRVSADCDSRNTASAALLARVGMRREAHHLASAWWKGEWTDEYVYAVLAEEWPAAHTGR